jgi:F-type H+-transporting ATPase subunit gamma
MASSRDIKGRIRSVKNIAQITKAMEVVSMTKMRKSQQFALAARPYALAALDMLRNILKLSKKKDIPDFLKARVVTNALIVVVTTDKGLVGGFNDAVITLSEARRAALQASGNSVAIITVGKKAKEFYARKGIVPVQSFDEYGDYTEFSETKPIFDAIISGYRNKAWDEVYIMYTHFKTTLRQQAFERKLLPTTESALSAIINEIIPVAGRYSDLKKVRESSSTHYHFTYTFEPSPKVLVEGLVLQLLRTAVHHLLLESNASEHSARMVTMKNARTMPASLKTG